MENKFKAGQVVRAIAHPGRTLVIRRYLDRVYYCHTQHNADQHFAYFEREIEAVDN